MGRKRLYSLSTRHPFYTTWYGMHNRCINIDRHNAHVYINKTVSKEWFDFERFKEDMFSTWRQGLQLDRIDNTKGYYKENCRWVTSAENNQNRSNNVVSRPLVEEIRERYKTEPINQPSLARQYGVSVSTINRIVNYKVWV